MKKTTVSLLVVALGIVDVNAVAGVPCSGGVGKLFAELDQELRNIDNSIPNVPDASTEYFGKEYSAATNSQATGRTRLVEGQPFFDEWRVRKALRSVEDYVRLVKSAGNSEALHPFNSAAKNRILWGSYIMLTADSLTKELTLYAAKQRSSSTPTLSTWQMYSADTMGGMLALTASRIIDCELQKMPSPKGDDSLKTYPYP